MKTSSITSMLLELGKGILGVGSGRGVVGAVIILVVKGDFDYDKQKVKGSSSPQLCAKE